MLIPRLDPAIEAKIDSSVRSFVSAKKLAQQLTSAAKQLVECLIEGQLTEDQLIPAQRLLETGDNSADQTILRRLKTDGVDGIGQGLFTDLDQLYTLLEQAREA